MNCADCDVVLDYVQPRRSACRAPGSALNYCPQCFDRRRGRVLRPAPGIVQRSSWPNGIGGTWFGGVQRSEPEGWFRKDARLSADIFCAKGAFKEGGEL